MPRPPLPLLAALALLACEPQVSRDLDFLEPRRDQLSLAGPVDVVLRLPQRARIESLTVTLDGEPLDPGLFERNARDVRAALADVGEGWHRLEAHVALLAHPGERGLPPAQLRADRRFEAVDLDDPDHCEILNDVECLLPYPSSRFLEPADTPTGYRVALPVEAMPEVLRKPISPEPLRELDGFGPGTNPLFFLPGGVDLALSGAPALDPETRSFDERSLAPDSPTLLIDARTGQRVLHFVELDARIDVSTDPARQVIFLRPGRTLEPGRRYIVAVRNLLHPDGAPVAPESVFAALRDRRPSTIPALEARRKHHEELFRVLRRAGVARDELQLVFDFVVQSQDTLTAKMLAMRDRIYAWLAEQEASGAPLFHVDSVEQHDCAQGGLWRDVQGTFRVPLFLTRNPLTENRELGFFRLDAEGMPSFEEIVDARFTVLVPCSARSGETLVRPLLHAHAGGGDFREPAVMHAIWNGSDLEDPSPGVPDRDSPLVAPHFLIGGTDNHGFGRLEFEGLAQSFLYKLFFEAGGAPALSARIHQGQANLLVLGRLMKRALLNDDPAFQTPRGDGVFPGPDAELYVWGVSFGGFSALIHAAISPDVDKAVPAVAVVNFANQAQRDTVLNAFEALLPIALGPDSMRHALIIAISHDLWAQADPVAYQTHIRRNPLRGVRKKQLLLPIGWLDQKSPNLFSDVAARDLGLASLAGSFRSELVGIRDQAGPLASAYVAYAPSLDANDSAHEPFLPPLENRTARPTPACDPHVLTWLTPAFLDQVGHYLRPGGAAESFCDGICDGAEPREREFANAERCDPNAP